MDKYLSARADNVAWELRSSWHRWGNFDFSNVNNRDRWNRGNGKGDSRKVVIRPARLTFFVTCDCFETTPSSSRCRLQTDRYLFFTKLSNIIGNTVSYDSKKDFHLISSCSDDNQWILDIWHQSLSLRDWSCEK